LFLVSCFLCLFCLVNLFILCFADAPTIRLIGSPEIDLEEDKDALVLRCVADANPPASIVWRRAGRSEIASLQVSKLIQATTKAPFYTNQPCPEIATSLCVFILSVAEICNCIKLPSFLRSLSFSCLSLSVSRKLCNCALLDDGTPDCTPVRHRTRWEPRSSCQCSWT